MSLPEQLVTDMMWLQTQKPFQRLMEHLSKQNTMRMTEILSPMTLPERREMLVQAYNEIQFDILALPEKAFKQHNSPAAKTNAVA